MVNEFFPARKFTKHDYGAGLNAKSTYQNFYFYLIFFFKSLANYANWSLVETLNRKNLSWEANLVREKIIPASYIIVLRRMEFQKDLTVTRL